VRGRAVWLALWVCLPGLAVAERPSLQALIDQTPANGTLVPPPGVYAGPISLDTPLTIDGQGLVTIDAGGKGSVVYLDTSGATLKGLHLVNSGESNNDIDAGVQVRGDFNVIKDCRIENCLFGIDLQQASHNIIRRNTISSKPLELGQRGDGIRLWYSFNNKVQENVCVNVRDTVVWYSADNEITGNRTTGSRYSLHFMYSRFNLVQDNWYQGNAVGIFLMYSDGVVVRGNHILHAAGPTGVGIGFKETSDLLIEDNEVMYCASGLYLDLSPLQPETTNRFLNNRIAYNGIGVRFLNDWHGNIFQGNQFADNMTQVFVSGGSTANHNEWQGNYWSDYQGFDRNHDGVGDTPHEIHAYADSIWRDSPYAQFFKGSPLLETLDFLERLVPLSTPELLVRDAAPAMRKAFSGGKPGIVVRHAP
jgi:nitrous oxidase accessory protein